LAPLQQALVPLEPQLQVAPLQQVRVLLERQLPVLQLCKAGTFGASTTGSGALTGSGAFGASAAGLAPRLFRSILPTTVTPGKPALLRSSTFGCTGSAGFGFSACGEEKWPLFLISISSFSKSLERRLSTGFSGAQLALLS
jgi:hypothetical protein